ncbi:hypothetical protein TWF192_006641 [Orbilia oligospora]|uniref:PARG catalytic Macro domain-containing protein n=2 Tax=Orbilia oligospora TaxID=2813651 RepID=A0A6G1M6Q1_ORBOL|nr:hypothetical protein TWF679_009854 [Orbilia oligospora]KAF3224755.1 hypothetical protein TWF191_005921 [Orbilia oligospora]KAF3247395.1 hypothetical protein TWF192_006641 [Orbilia oligospora]
MSAVDTEVEVSNSELEQLLLPNHSSFTTEDPLGFSDTDEYPVPVYSILESLLFRKFESISQTIPPEALTSEFVSVVSDLSYTLHNRPDPNLSILKSCISGKPDPIAYIQLIVHSASKLPILFPSGSLHPLNPAETRTYTKAHLLSILSHQFLLTLPSPKWNDWGGINLTPWYSDADGITEPKRTYTNITLEYFKQSTAPSNQSQKFLFHLFHNQIPPSLTAKIALVPLKILELPIEEDFPKTTLPTDNFHITYVISSHKLIGHGPSATQEERILASIPELLPVSAFTPPLKENTALAVTASAEGGFIPTAVFTGHGRTARKDNSYNHEDYEGENMERRIRVNTFLFLNATELDAVEIPEGAGGGSGMLPDFLPGILQRDLLKAYTGFFGVFDSQARKGEKRDQRIVATPWGSGAFGGDVRVKLLILWVAASFAAASLEGGQKAELVFLVKQFVVDAKEVWWKEMLKKVQDSGVGADDVWRALLEMEGNGTANINVLEGIVDALGLERPHVM